MNLNNLLPSLFAFAFLKTSVMASIPEHKIDTIEIVSGMVPTIQQGQQVGTAVSLISVPRKDVAWRDYVLVVPDRSSPNAILTIWSLYPLKNWALITDIKPIESYLAWQDKSYICISKLPNPVILGYESSFGSGFPSYWHADHFINLKDYEKWGNASTNSDESEIIISSVETIPNGMTVTATNKLGEHLRFLKSKDGWHAFIGESEVHRLRWNPIDWGIAKEGNTKDVIYSWNNLVFTNATGTPINVTASLSPKFGSLYHYQLYESTNHDVRFSLPIWSDNKLSRPVWEVFVGNGHWGNFSIVGNGKGDGYYLCWTDLRGRLCLSAITNRWPEAKYVEDPNVGPFSYPKDDPFMRGGVDHIIDLRQFADGDRFFKGGGGVASAKQENNVLTLTVTNASGSKFTFSNQDGQWHAYSFWGEIKRVKP
jgi:hypothetical protein